MVDVFKLDTLERLGLIIPRTTSKVLVCELGADVTTMVAAGRMSTCERVKKEAHPLGEDEEGEGEGEAGGKKEADEAGEGMPRRELMKASWIWRFCRSTKSEL